jgi:hypothetical protein
MYAFWEIIASNAVVATILAIGAMLLSRIWKNAAAVHVLWVIVLLKLFTPPLVTSASRARDDHGLLVASCRLVGELAVARTRRTVLRRPRPRTTPASTTDVRRRTR